MSDQAKRYVALGQLKRGRVVELDEPVPLGDARVQVSIQALSPGPTRPLTEVLAEIRRQQAERRFVPPSRDQVDRLLAAERDSWDR